MENHTAERDGSLVTHAFKFNGRQVSITTEEGTRIDEKLTIGHFYEHHLLGYITALAPAGVFLDIGGNCGQHAVYFALFCPSTIVYCVEPLPEHVALIRRNIEANNLSDKIRVLPVAGSDTVKACRIDTNAANFPKHISATGYPLDDMITGPVSVIKIDVEGMEPEVIRGLSKTIRTYKPMIFAECLNPTQLAATVAELGSLGYSTQEPEMCFHNTMYQFIPK